MLRELDFLQSRYHPSLLPDRDAVCSQAINPILHLAWRPQLCSTGKGQQHVPELAVTLDGYVALQSRQRHTRQPALGPE